MFILLFRFGLGQAVTVVEHYLFHKLVGFIYLYLHFLLVCQLFIHYEIDRFGLIILLLEYTIR